MHEREITLVKYIVDQWLSDSDLITEIDLDACTVPVYIDGLKYLQEQYRTETCLSKLGVRQALKRWQRSLALIQAG